MIKASILKRNKERTEKWKDEKNGRSFTEN